MPGTTLGTAYVQIVPSAQGIKGSITEVLGGEAESAGVSVGKKIGSFAKKAIIAAGIGAVAVKGIKDAMTQGAELQQNIGGAYAVFGEQLYGSLEEKATQAYRNMGLSASEYYATANKMGSLFQGSGISQQKSLDLTTKAMQRAADVASVMGLDTTAAMESIAGAAKGNFTMMDNLGVAMNATTLEAYALEKGLNFKWNTASNAEKAELAMKMFMDRTSQYAGNFARESDETFSGSLGAMKAAYQDFVGSLAIGENVSESMNALMSTASTFFFNNFIPMLGTIFKALPGAMLTFVKQGIPVFASGISSLVSSLASNVGNLANSLTGEKVAAWVSASLPKFLSAAGSMIGKFVQGLITNLPKVVSVIRQISLAIVTGLGSAIWGKVSTAASGIVTRFMQPFTTLADKVKGVINKIKGYFPINIGKIMSNIKLPHFSISGKFGLNPPQTPKLSIDWYAKGGIVSQPAVFGGIGMGDVSEAIVPLDPFWKKMDKIAENTRSGDTFNIYIEGAGKNADEIVNEVERKLVNKVNRRRLAWQ